MFSVIATALGVATVAITLVSGPSTTAASGTAGGTLVDAQIVEVYVFLLAAFTGYQIITKVPPLLHTPLMAATNAISAISLVASLVIAGAERPFYINVMGAVAVAAATINVVGGFVITDRMLKMFRKTEAPK
ncbi:MAG TPA: pyridine nucleotide transhydrogenase [Chloroflexi bacterium]|jgi:NAD(P) transhydrogenase subunit alpha|nr:pyridine nucleotide transhydrogenase [Chloroflexota bacterium]